MGKWMEVASIPQEWSDPCVGATATYRMISANSIEVTNRCLDEKGEIIGMFTGHAKAKYPTQNLGHFMVNFGRVSGDYIVLDTDYDSYALVGGSSPDMLWILKRQDAIMSEAYYTGLVRKAKSMGYNVNDLKMDTYQ
jgi:lipocalin